MGLQEMRENMAYMTPTQAQIEAEDDARLFGTGFIKTLPDGTQTRIDPREIYMTTPTQAQIAHVIFNRIANGEDVPEKQRNELLEFLGLTAAADAGEQKAIKLGSWEQKIVNATIERCAQVAESGIQLTSGGNLIAAAIRALKDKP